MLPSRDTRPSYSKFAYLYIESHHEWIFMRLGGSDSPGDLRPDVAADLLGFVVADLGLEFGPQTGVLVRAPGKGLETLALLEEVGALLVEEALRGGGALPLCWLDPGTQGQQQDKTLHRTDIRITVY